MSDITRIAGHMAAMHDRYGILLYSAYEMEKYFDDIYMLLLISKQDCER